MVKDLFANILEELGNIFKLKLAPDANNACLVKFKSGLNVNMEFDGAQEKIVIVGSSRVDLQACKLEYSIVSPK